jgi:aromatic-L-amino-acid decarboxylase
MLADMLAAGLNANCGGRNHIGIDVERQIASWSAGIFNFPQTASGLFVTGTSAANLTALLVARSTVGNIDLRRDGLREAGGQLVAYTSAEAHGCITQAVEVAGVGSRHLRAIPVDCRGRMEVRCLAEAIERDRADGLQPFIVVGTAGTVNTGAIDDLTAIAKVCKEQSIWFHVDGALGALCAIAPKLRPLIAGIEQADSIAFDFHKWAHVPYDAGFVLVKDSTLHLRAFANEELYLKRAPSGLAAGEVWPCDLGIDLSRGFRALKAWFTFRVFGTEKIGACIEKTCALAQYLESRIAASDLFEIAAPVTLNIVCFRLKAAGVDALNRVIVCDLHDRGIAAPSTTELYGKSVIRAAIVNHRTSETDIDCFVDALRESAVEVLSRHASSRLEQPGVEIVGLTVRSNPDHAVGTPHRRSD